MHWPAQLEYCSLMWLSTCSSTVQSWLKVSGLFGWQILPLMIYHKETRDSTEKVQKTITLHSLTNVTWDILFWRCSKHLCQKFNLWACDWKTNPGTYRTWEGGPKMERFTGHPQIPWYTRLILYVQDSRTHSVYHSWLTAMDRTKTCSHTAHYGMICPNLL